jgi:hypothetical protein
MVFLTMTTAMVEALEKVQTLTTSEDRTQELGTKEVDVKESLQSSNEREAGDQEDEGKARITKTAESLIRDGGKEKEGNSKSAEPSLSDPKVGNPISHGQVIDLSNELKSRGISPRTLDVLLRGAGIYVPPPKPKPKPVSVCHTFLLLGR